MTTRTGPAVCLALALAGCGGAGPAPAGERRVRVSAASDLKFALDEIVAGFARERPAVRVEVTYGSSGNFFNQLVNKAPFDLFLSADADLPHRLVEQGLAAQGAEFRYA